MLEAVGGNGDLGSVPTCLVLIVEDDATLLSSVAHYLGSNGFRVVTALDGLAGLRALDEERPDIVLLDLTLPKVDGLEVCRRIRSKSEVPIIILTARSGEVDRVVGLELGADDYMTKPFSLRELTARIRALLRRSIQRPREEDAKKIRIGDIELDPRGRTVLRRGREIPMKPKEFDLLSFFAHNADQVCSRQQLLERVWGYESFGATRTVDVHVRWLREKIEDDAGRPRHLLTVRAVGYKFVR